MNMKRRIRTITYITLAFLLCFSTFFSAAAKDGALSILGCYRQDGRFQFLISVPQGTELETKNARASVSGIGVDALQLYPYEDLNAGGITICLVPNIGANKQGRSVEDMHIGTDGLLSHLGRNDNVCIAGEDKLDYYMTAAAAKEAVRSLETSQSDPFEQIKTAVQTLPQDARANTRQVMVIFSDCMNQGAQSEELRRLVAQARIPIVYVSLLYNTDTIARKQIDQELRSLTNESISSTVFAPGLQHQTIVQLGDEIFASFGRTYIVEITQKALSRFGDPTGKTLKIEIETEDNVLSDEMILESLDGSRQIHAGLIDNQQAIETQTQRPDEMPATSQSPIPTPSQTPAQTTSEPVRTPETEAACENETNPVPSPDNDIRQEKITHRIFTWFSGRSTVVQICIVGSGALLVACVILLPILQRRKRNRRVVNRICLVRLTEKNELKTELNMGDRLTIGVGGRKNMLTFADDPNLAPREAEFVFRKRQLCFRSMSHPPKKTVLLKPGDIVLIGSYRYRVFWDDPT